MPIGHQAVGRVDLSQTEGGRKYDKSMFTGREAPSMRLPQQKGGVRTELPTLLAALG